jgi:hypothetical protein
MDYLLVARSMRLAHDGKVFSLAFTDSAGHPRRQVVLRKQMTAASDGMQLDLGDQSRSSFRAIASIEVREERARLFLTAHGQAVLGCESVIVAFAGADLRGAFGALAGVVDDEFPITVSVAPPAGP